MLQQAGFVRLHIPKQLKVEIYALDSSQFPSLKDFQRYIEINYKAIVLSDQYRRKKSEELREFREWDKKGEYAPPVNVGELEPRNESEPDATPKQKQYLRNLGVKDEEVIAKLGRSQASALIDNVIQQRDSIQASPAQEKKGKGCLVLCGVLFALIAIVILLNK